jgi:DNA-binding NarL/FixJ family response regulator
MTTGRARLATLLTPREMEVLALLGAGCSNREIAERMQVCEDTVKYHLKSIYRVLGARRRTQALLAAQQAGLLAAAGP